MSVESIPKGRSESSIIDLPKTVKPEIGREVEEFSDREIVEKKNEENELNKMKEKGWSEEDIKGEMIYDAAIGYEKDKFSEEVHKDWAERYSEDPLFFFSEGNYEILKNISQKERLIYLAKTGYFLSVTPKNASEYFSEFPEDINAVKIIYENEHGFPESSTSNQLFSISALDLDALDPKLKERFDYFNDYINISERRNIAPRLLMNGFNESKRVEKLKRFGKGAEGFLKLMDRAADFEENMRYPIDPEYMITEDFKEMSDKDKAEFLRECIRDIQFHLVFDEVFNRGSTVEDEEENKKDVIERIKKGEDHFQNQHSMIYRTYHPVSIYKTDQEKFDYTINHSASWGGPVEDYPYEKILLVVLNELKGIELQKDENSDVLVDFWDKNRNPVFGNAVSDTLSSQNPERASSQLLELIKEEKDDKRPLSAILYRLEFGNIGISEEGVNYLERMYDLGEYNDPDFQVSRLTANGEVGIFNEDLKLMKYFHLGDLSTDEKKIQAKVMDFAYETLFYSNPNENPEERTKREKYLQDFKENYYKIANDKVFEQTGARLNNLSFKEQGWFVIYYNQASEEEKDQLRDFVQEYGEEGIKTFLSLESGDEMGNNVLNIGKELESKVVHFIFSKYNEIIDLTEKSRDELEKLFKDKRDISDEEIENIIQNLINKAGCVLINFAKKIEKGEKIEKEDIIKELEEYKTDIILTASIYRGIDKKDGIAFEDLKGVTFENISSGQIISDENLKKDIVKLYKDSEFVNISKKSLDQVVGSHSASKGDIESVDHIFQMMEIYSRNYEDRPVFREKLLSEFLEALTKNEDNTNFYMYKKDDDIVAFSRFDQLENRKILAASLNVRDVACNSHIGKIFSDKCIKKESCSGDIIASCDAFSPAASGHLESGFVGGEVVEDYNKEDKESNNIPAFIIEKKRGKKYDSQNLGREELIKEYNKNFKDNKFNKEDMIILKLDSKSPELLNISKNLINKESYVMTRYFYTDKKCKEAYCVFESDRS